MSFTNEVSIDLPYVWWKLSIAADSDADSGNQPTADTLIYSESGVDNNPNSAGVFSGSGNSWSFEPAYQYLYSGHGSIVDSTWNSGSRDNYNPSNTSSGKGTFETIVQMGWDAGYWAGGRGLQLPICWTTGWSIFIVSGRVHARITGSASTSIAREEKSAECLIPYGKYHIVVVFHGINYDSPIDIYINGVESSEFVSQDSGVSSWGGAATMYGYMDDGVNITYQEMFRKYDEIVWYDSDLGATRIIAHYDELDPSEFLNSPSIESGPPQWRWPAHKANSGIMDDAAFIPVFEGAAYESGQDIDFLKVISGRANAYTSNGTGVLRFYKVNNKLSWQSPGQAEGNKVEVTRTGRYDLPGATDEASLLVNVENYQVLPSSDTSANVFCFREGDSRFDDFKNTIFPTSITTFEALPFTESVGSPQAVTATASGTGIVIRTSISTMQAETAIAVASGAIFRDLSASMQANTATTVGFCIRIDEIPLFKIRIAYALTNAQRATATSVGNVIPIGNSAMQALPATMSASGTHTPAVPPAEPPALVPLVDYQLMYLYNFDSRRTYVNIEFYLSATDQPGRSGNLPEETIAVGIDPVGNVDPFDSSNGVQTIFDKITAPTGITFQDVGSPVSEDDKVTFTFFLNESIPPKRAVPIWFRRTTPIHRTSPDTSFFKMWMNYRIAKWTTGAILNEVNFTGASTIVAAATVV